MVYQPGKSVSTGKQLPTYHAVLIVGQPKNLLEKRILSMLEMARIYLCCCVSTPVQIAVTYISCQNQGQTPEDESGRNMKKL